MSTAQLLCKYMRMHYKVDMAIDFLKLLPSSNEILDTGEIYYTSLFSY
jgi:hypothetical protein